MRGAGTEPIRDGYGDAINWFDEIIKKYPTHSKAAMAECLIASCQFQKASEELLPDQVKKRLDNALQAYQKALGWLGADVTTRSLAEFGLAQVLERQNKTDDAQSHLENVFYEKNLIGTERPDTTFIREAGLELAKLFEDQKNWAKAKGVCAHLIEKFPPLRMSMNLRIERIEKKSSEN